MADQKTVHAVWNRGWVCDVAMGEFGLRIDEPESVPGGTNLGPNPTEMLLGSVASCFTLALTYAAKRRHVELDHLLVDATGTYDGKKFGAIHIDAEIGCAIDLVAPLIADAEQFCYVTNTIRGGAELSVSGTAHGATPA